MAYFERHLEDEIFKLHIELVTKKYKHAKYTDFYICDPKPRHISKAVVRDRVVHHAIFQALNPIFEPTFISDSYSCRKGFGTHKGFKRLVSYSRTVSRNYTAPCWALKGDIKKFFDSVDHKILLKLIKLKVKDPEVLWLVKKTVESYSTNKGKGIPIGNLTSQLFANLYLNELDQFVKHTLKAKYYLRYADDFIILNQDPRVLLDSLGKLETFLKQKLQLKLHEKKVSLRKLDWGIDFVGYVALPYHQVLRTKTKKRIFRKVSEKVSLYKSGEIDEQTLNQSIQAYFGVLKHANTYKLKAELSNSLFFCLAS